MNRKRNMHRYKSEQLVAARTSKLGLKLRRKVEVSETNLPAASPLGPLVSRSKRERSHMEHLDYIAARNYCRVHGKTLRDLTKAEMEQFKTRAVSVRF